MNLTSSLTTMLALSTSQAYIGTFNVPIGYHTIDLNTLNVNACTGAGSNPNMAHTKDANFTLLGDPSGGSYIQPTTYVANGVMFQVNGGRVKCKNIRFNGQPMTDSYVQPYVPGPNQPIGGGYWYCFQLNGDVTIGRPNTRTFLLEECEFRHCARAIIAHNFENIRTHGCRYEVTRDPPDIIPECGNVVAVQLLTGSQNAWFRNSETFGQNGYYVSDSFDEGTSSPSLGRFWFMENLINAKAAAVQVARGQQYIICGGILDTNGSLGVGIDFQAAAGHTINGISVFGAWSGANCNYKQVYANCFEIAVVGCQIIGNAQQTGITLSGVQNIEIVGCQINMPGAGGLDVFSDSTVSGVRYGINCGTSPGGISDAGNHNWWLNNRMQFNYTSANTGDPTNMYQTQIG